MRTRGTEKPTSSDPSTWVTRLLSSLSEVFAPPQNDSSCRTFFGVADEYEEDEEDEEDEDETSNGGVAVDEGM